MSYDSVTMCPLTTEVMAGHPLAAGSVVRQCGECTRDIYASPSSIARENTLLVCSECGVTMMKADDAPELMPPSDAMRVELHKAGMTDADIDQAWAAIQADPRLMKGPRL